MAQWDAASDARGTRQDAYQDILADGVRGTDARRGDARGACARGDRELGEDAPDAGHTFRRYAEQAHDAPPASQWGLHRLDVAAYLGRMAYDGPLAPTLETLRGLHRAHVATIPFENLDVIIGRGIGTDLDSLQAKLVRRYRGGYCYEHNLLFAALLERLGFRLTRLAGRVRMGTSEPRPRTHMLLRVEADGAEWLADVGFGGEGLLEPLPLDDGTTMTQGSWAYRLDRGEDGTWLLRSWHRDGWFDLYTFTLEPQQYVDYVMANHFISTHPDSPFVGRLVVQSYGPDVRHTLVGRSLTVRRGDGSRDRRRFAVPDLPDVLERIFGIVLTPEERIRLGSPAAGS